MVIGILAVAGAANYLHTVQETQNREAESYLQTLRQAALAYRETWNAYPTALAQVPQAMVPSVTDRSSHWVYTFSGTNPAQWTTPTATSKDDGRQITIQESGTIVR